MWVNILQGKWALATRDHEARPCIEWGLMPIYTVCAHTYMIICQSSHPELSFPFGIRGHFTRLCHDWYNTSCQLTHYQVKSDCSMYMIGEEKLKLSFKKLKICLGRKFSHTFHSNKDSSVTVIRHLLPKEHKVHCFLIDFLRARKMGRSFHLGSKANPKSTWI